MKRAHQRRLIAVGLVPRYLRASEIRAELPNVGFALNCEIDVEVRSAPLSSLRKFGARPARTFEVGMFRGDSATRLASTRLPMSLPQACRGFFSPSPRSSASVWRRRERCAPKYRRMRQPGSIEV